MPNLINTLIAQEYEELLPADLDALFVQPIGLSVEQVNGLRAALEDAELQMRLLKSTLAARALSERGLEGTDPIFEGPAAVIVSVAEGADATAINAAKVVDKWRKASGVSLPEIKGGVMDGTVLVGEAAEKLKTMPGRQEVLATLVGQILGPARSLASQLQSPGSKIAGAIQTHIENQE